jgi:hypothetical protein
MGVKSEYITALLKTPEGIEDFLDVGAPVFAHFDPPTTADEAQIAQGMFAYNLNEWLCKFGANGSNTGLKLVPLLLRIGQHNSVAMDILLSGLEYLTDSAGNQEFEIIEPVAGKKYAPGDLRLVVSAKSSRIATVDVSLTHGASYDTVSLQPDNNGARWYGYAVMGLDEDIIDAQFDFSVVFDDKEGTTKTATVAITIEDDGASDADLSEVENARIRALAATDGVIEAWNPIEAIATGGTSLGKKIAIDIANDVVASAIKALTKAITSI